MKTPIYTWTRACFILVTTGAFLCGCIYIHESTSTSSSNVDAKAVTNRALSGGIPMTVKSVEVENRCGYVHVVGVESSGAGWTWNLAVGAKTDVLAKQAAEAANCQAVMDGDKLRLTVELPDSFHNANFQSDIEVRVPRTATVRTSNKFGETRVSDIAGDVEATGQSGAMELRDLGGKVRAENSFGGLSLEGAAAAVLRNRSGLIEASHIRGALDAETSFAEMKVHDIEGAVKLSGKSGRIEARHIKGAAEISTTFGEIRAEDIDGAATLIDQSGEIDVAHVTGDAVLKTSFAQVRAEMMGGNLKVSNQSGRIIASGIASNVQARTTFAEMEIEGSGLNFDCRDQSGSIHLTVTSPALKSIEAETSFAPIEVRLPGGLKPAVQAHTTFADVDSDFPILARPPGQDPFAGVEAGIPRIQLRDQSGKIRISSAKMAER